MPSVRGPSEDSQPSSQDSPRRRVRKCRVLFVLGSGTDPSDVADVYADRYRRSRSPDVLDFASAEQVVGTAAEWPRDRKSAHRPAVLEFVRSWCAANGVELDEKLLLIRRFTTDDGRAIAVAGYFPDTFPDSEAAAEPGAVSETASGRSGGAGGGQAFVSRVTTALRQISRTQLLVSGGSALAVLLAYLVTTWLWSDDSSDIDRGTAASQTDDSDAGRADSGGSDEQSPRLAPPVFLTGVLRVYTPEPGFGVLIDGQPVRDADGAPVLTPCAVTVEQGSRSVTVFREGSFDLTQQVDAGEDTEVTLRPSEDAVGAGSDYLNAPYRLAEVGRPVPLESLNSPLAEFDPFITPDGLSIWFAGDRPDGRGIFVATRLSPWHEFDPPEIVQTSADLAASPSVTSDGLSLVYAVPEKARLLSMTRDNPLSPFSNWQPLANRDSLVPDWLSSQILGDGKRLYWVEEDRGRLRTLAATRESIYDEFGKPYAVRMPGTHPRMSQDGLRQYSFDGRTLTRYRRQSRSKRFVADGVVAEIELPSFRSAARSRQFAVSGDEQWMFYCDDPDGTADLYMVRLADAPRWGVVPLGKPIAPRTEVAAVEMKEPEEPRPVAPEVKPVDPRSLPLPYEAHWQAFSQLIGQRQYEAAAGLLVNAETNPALEPFREVLDWDRDDLSAIREFWESLIKNVSQIEPGTSVRVGTRRGDFVKVEAGELVTKRGDLEVRRKITEFDATELSTLFDEVFERDDSAAAYRFFVLLTYDAEAIEQTRERRREQAGPRAEEFRRRQVQRYLKMSRAELARSRFSNGVRLLKEAERLAGSSPVAAEVRALEGELYSYIKWQPRGPRKWMIQDHEYSADASRANGSLLVSEQRYENFELSLEWKTQNLQTAQGGVYFRYNGGNDLNNGAFKIHLANDAGVPPDQYSTGSLFTDTPPDRNVTRPAGEWNSLEMTVRGDIVEVTINGSPVLTASVQSDDLPRRGLIALDGVAGGITYRKVLISELPAE